MSKIYELDNKQDWYHNAAALAILLITFIVYNITKAPTLSFWDCGEFIACSYTLGIPHPPGTPLYIMLGRIFSIIPFHEDISANVNMLSAVTGAFAAMFAFLTTFKLIRWWWPSEEFSGWKKATAYIGSIVGSLMFAFGRTHWNNTVEAEVYTPAMLIMIVTIWLLLVWIEKRDSASSDKYLILISYLAFLSIGIHLTTFLIMPAVFLAVILFSERLRKDIRFYLAGFCLVLIAYSFESFVLASGVWLVVSIVGTIVKKDRIWKLSLGLVLAAIIGYSCQLYTPIRSAQQPSINQNNPSESYTAFNNFLERKQYMQESMITRAMTRRAELINQFGNYPRMGFWRFFSHQYGINGRPFAFLFVLGLLGLYELIRRKPEIGWPFLFMILLGTVVLVLYMNFADGTRQNPITGDGHIEVRDRDYFFTPGFVLFGIALGLGTAGLLEMARQSIMRKIAFLRTPIMVFVSALVLLVTAPVMANYHIADRSNNYIPYDFAKNYLDSCEPNSILFIAGDNDTFPIWCLQEVYGYRTDVTVVNLMLSNLPWYIKQIRDQKNIPLRFTDAQINSFVPQIYPNGRRVRVQDRVLDEILNVNQWQKSIYFAITIPHDMRQYNGASVQPNLIMQGLAYRLEPGKIAGKIDMEKNYDLYFNKFSYRSLADESVYKDERTKALTGNYTTGLQLMADSLRKIKQFDKAIALTKKAAEIVPYEYSSYNYLAQLYVEAGMEDKIPELVKQVPEDKEQDIYFIWGMAHKYEGHLQKANVRLRFVFENYPHFNDGFREYSRLLYESKHFTDLRKVIETWVNNNPDDAEAPKMLESLNRSLYTPAQDS
ncbi:MAG: DUF2723 domain-containing protein [candidate division Zixibacteria bacterium]|nr:DUF2723 domain-containing protein [candidate division Zixibacteria bacterium]